MRKFSSKTNDFCFIDWDGVIIPMVMPKIMIPPASFTLASHVPLFIAMFYTRSCSGCCARYDIWFLLTTPVIIALRALSHLVCVDWGLVLAKHPSIVLKWTVYFANWRFQGFNL